MASAMGCILQAATRQEGEPLNILTAPTHERYESNLAKTKHRFWAIRTSNLKDWNIKYARIPENYTLLNPERENAQLPPGVEFDLILSQHKFGQYQILAPLSKLWNVPLISLEHTLPMKKWDNRGRMQLRQMAGNINVFISDYSRAEWGFGAESVVVPHGIDCEQFSPLPSIPRKEHILSVVNDWINRDEPCGFKIWQESLAGLKVCPVGNTPGLSEPAQDIHELVRYYRQARVFVNTSLVSPIPTALLEAMSCGAPVVSLATCAIPEIIKHGENGLLATNAQELRQHCELLLKDHRLGAKLGLAARQTILKDFSLQKFVKNWDYIFTKTVKEFNGRDIRA